MSANIPPALPEEAAFAASGTCITVQGRNHVWIATGGDQMHRLDRRDVQECNGVLEIAYCAFEASGGGIGYAIDIARPMGQRISDITLLKTGKPIEAGRNYMVSGWASVNEGTQGPPIWDVVRSHVGAQKTIQLKENTAVRVTGT